MRPEIRLLRIHAPRVAHVGYTPGPGAAPGPSRPRQKSEQLPAAGSHTLGRPARLPAFCCAPETVQRAPVPSSAPSRAAPRPPSCSPPPQGRPDLFSSGGVFRAPGAYLHVAPLGPPLPASEPGQRVVAPLTRSPTRASATADTSSPSAAEHNARSASTSSRQMQLRAPDTMPPLARPPLKAWLRPFASRTAGTSSFCPKCPHAETTPALEGPAGSGPPAAKAICTPLETTYVTFDPLHSTSRDNHCGYIDSDT